MTVHADGTTEHLERVHSNELFKIRGKYFTNVKKVVKKLKKDFGDMHSQAEMMEFLQDCSLVQYPESSSRSVTFCYLLF